jgi:RND family efflux transporter MFP subunit
MFLMSFLSAPLRARHWMTAVYTPDRPVCLNHALSHVLNHARADSQALSRSVSLSLIAACLLATAAPVRAEDAKPAAQAGARSGPRPALVVNTVKPVRAEFADTLTANGSIAAWQEAIVGAEINGLRIAEVRTDVGDAVRRGQVLAVFNTDTVRADLAQTQAELANAQAALAEARAGLGETQAAAAEAQANAERARAVESSGALSAQQINQYLTSAQTAQARLQSSQARVQSAQARVQSVQAQVHSQQLRLKMTQVLAPDDGVISARSATVGAVVSGGQELFRLVRKNRLEWRAEVTATELARIRPKQSVKVVPASGTSIDGTVRMIGPVVDAQTRNALVYVDLPASGVARAGMFARGEFRLGSSMALTVPQQAVVVRDGFSYVFRVNGDRVAQLKVRTGRRMGDRVEIQEGLSADAVLVGAGAAFLNDGDLVQVAQAAPAAGAGK